MKEYENYRDGRHSRTEALIGQEALEKLKNAKVAVIGLGGVGSFTLEALARSGIQNFLLLDSDCISESNINRQNLALYSKLGQAKTHVAKERILEINPEANCVLCNIFFGKETADSVDFTGYNFIADAIDNVTAKIILAEKAQKLNIPIISSMGTGNKLHPEMFKIADISKTKVCPLARVMRHELKAREIKNYTVVYSEEVPIISKMEKNTHPETKKPIPASISFVPASAGLLMASYIIQKIIES
ncbi:MAG: tRNA threonylcarbamoyladenosine dehydratase [Spirochaetaceae bacterium]|nr:tRNA threonylcarbamoyladenosine dehydratase [Spirochaetaceae bacterium]